MKKKSLIVLVLLLIGSPVLAQDDIDMNNLWDNFGSNQEFFSQTKDNKTVSDDELDKIIEQVKEKHTPWGKKLKQKLQTPRGEAFSESNETEEIEDEQQEATLPVLSLPVEIDLGNGVYLPVGHYQINAEKEGEDTFIKFYQAHYLMAKIPATETEDDFDEEELLFGKWLVEDEDNLKIIFGSVDLNAFTYVKVLK